MNSTQLTLDQWEEKYKPLINTITDNSSWQNDKGEGIMFETYDAEFEFVRSQPDETVWTWIDGDDGSYIITGLAFVNRIGYFVTTEPWTDHVEIQVDTYYDNEEEEN